MSHSYYPPLSGESHNYPFSLNIMCWRSAWSWQNWSAELKMLWKQNRNKQACRCGESAWSGKSWLPAPVGWQDTLQSGTSTTTHARLYNALENETGKVHSPNMVNLNAGSPLEALAKLRLTRPGLTRPEPPQAKVNTSLTCPQAKRPQE